jgi:hypothetical protein
MTSEAFLTRANAAVKKAVENLEAKGIEPAYVDRKVAATTTYVAGREQTVSYRCEHGKIDPVDTDASPKDRLNRPTTRPRSGVTNAARHSSQRMAGFFTCEVFMIFLCSRRSDIGPLYRGGSA